MPFSTLFKKKTNVAPTFQTSASIQKNQSKAPNQSLYKPQPQQTSRSTYQGPSNPISSLVGKINQSPYKPSTQPTQQQGGQSKMIQGSGMTPNYMSNPSNYRSPSTTSQGQQGQQGQQQVQYDPMLAANAFLANQRKSAQERQDYENKMRADNEASINAQFGLANDALRASIPEAQAGFDRFKTNTQQGLEQLGQQSKQQKAQIKEQFGEAQRRAAQTRNEVSGQTARKFASLGSVDSGGEGSYGRAQENIDSDFNRATQLGLNQQANQLSNIDNVLFQAKSDAQNKINEEEAKLNQLVQQINTQLAGNEIAKGDALRQAYQMTQEKIFAIQDSLSNLEYQADVERMNINNKCKRS